MNFKFRNISLEKWCLFINWLQCLKKWSHNLYVQKLLYISLSDKKIENIFSYTLHVHRLHWIYLFPGLGKNIDYLSTTFNTIRIKSLNYSIWQPHCYIHHIFTNKHLVNILNLVCQVLVARDLSEPGSSIA